jgi:hypothetical protein
VSGTTVYDLTAPKQNDRPAAPGRQAGHPSPRP